MATGTGTSYARELDTVYAPGQGARRSRLDGGNATF